MVFEQHALRLGEGAEEIGRHQLAKTLATENPVRFGLGGLPGDPGVGGGSHFAGETGPDALPRRLDGAGIDRLITDGGDGLLETLFGLHDASPMRRVISLRRR